MDEYLATLEDAIADVGYWRWWAEDLPEVFQVEFGGVQLWNPPTTPDGPPCGVVALRFKRPTVVAFLTSPAAEVPPDWRMALHEDRIQPFGVRHNALTLHSGALFMELIAGCDIEYVQGSEAELQDRGSPAMLAFRAGPVGFAIRAHELAVISSSGEMVPGAVRQASERWWAYWREYWNRRDSDAPFPMDYACEVTLPLAQC